MYIELQCVISIILAASALPSLKSGKYLIPDKNANSKELIKSDAITHLRLLGQTRHRQDITRLRFGNPITDATKYPFLVSIQIPTAHMFAGVAVVISKYWVLTTAENVEAVENLLTITRLVSNTLDAQIDGPGTLHNITRARRHPDYQPTSKIHNVGVMRACPPFTVSSHAFLPRQGQVLAFHTSGTIAAWAADGSVLYDFTMDVNEDSNCTQLEFTDPRNQFCNIVEGPSPICETSDTGTPWFVDDTVVGLASSAHCTDSKPDVFVEVANYADWILDASEAKKVG